MSKVKASKTLSVPSHMYRHCRMSTVGPKRSAYLARVGELTPSQATTRSWRRAQLVRVGRLGPEAQPHPELAAPVLQDPQQPRRLIAAKP